MTKETRYDRVMKRHYWVKHYCPTCEKEQYENDFAGATSQKTIRAAGLNVQTNRLYVAYY